MPSRLPRSLLRTTLRFAGAGACLLSLGVCVAAAWLRWHAPQVLFDRAEASTGRTYVRAFSSREGLAVTVVRGWPGPSGAWAAAVEDQDDPQYGQAPRLTYRAPPARGEFAAKLGLETYSAPMGVPLAADGTALRGTTEWNAPAGGLRPSPPMDGWMVVKVPHLAVVAGAAVLPLAWLAVRLGRAVVGRRGRPGWCPRCGRDMPEGGTCPACEPPPADGAK